METVLVVGSSGNMGVSAIIAAQRSNRAVIAVVRNDASKQKVLSHIDSPENVTFVEADVTSDDGLQDVVDRVRKGDLPAFQHVFATVGLANWTTPIQSLDLASFREVMKVSLESNYLAYRATIPYLIEQGGKPTFTLMTGGAGDLGVAGVTAIGQGALFSLANVACLENMKTNIRFNELYLRFRVEYDSNIDDQNPQGKVKASKFAEVYERILQDENINGCRVRAITAADIDDVKYEKKLPDFMYHA